ncbi:MAG: hypothetical protein ACK4UN_08840 [Limisphaerales bacterium]
MVMWNLTRYFLAAVMAVLASFQAQADVNINILGFRYESRSSQAPSLDLTVRRLEPVMAGTWSAELSRHQLGKNERLWFTISVREATAHHSFGIQTEATDQYSFLFADKKSWRGSYEILTTAGNLVLLGNLSVKKASGDFTFTVDQRYLDQASTHMAEPPSSVELLQLGLQAVTISDIQTYAANGLKLTAANVLRLKRSGVAPDYVLAVRKAGNFSIEEIVRMRNAGVQQDFPSALKEARYDFNAEQLVRLRHSGISAADAAAWKKAGFDFDAEGLVRMRNSGVKPEFGQVVGSAINHITPEELVRLRNSGVAPEFVVTARKADPSLTVEELVRLRNSGVTADYLKAWRDAGCTYRAEEIIRLRNAGVPMEYAAALQMPNRKPLTAETLIRLRNRGLTAQEIRELRE